MATGLTLKQKKFCEIYVSEDKEFYGNGTRSYAEAYGIDLEKNYKSANVEASKHLAKPSICNYINQLLDTKGFNDENVDKQHLFLLNQHGDLKTKLGAINSYNQLKDRINRGLKLEITVPDEAQLERVKQQLLTK